MTFDPARKFLGLNHCQQFLNLGLGLSKATVDFFLSLDIPVFQLYGMTESSGLHTVSSHQAVRLPRWVGWGALSPPHPSGQQLVRGPRDPGYP